MDEIEIKELINLKREGPYWDFKRQWYDASRNGDMLHDVLCMANNLENRDCYIIIGIDEENDYSFCDVSKDPNKRTTQMLVDFLREKKFAGDIRPEVSVERINIDYNAVDVLVVYNTMKTPYYLKEDYKGVHKNNIYTRIQDTNTPINKTADIHDIELLWKKRFGIIQTPLERFKVYLKDKSMWNKSPSFEEKKYNISFPEFTIEYPLEDPYRRDDYEFYLFNQTNNKPWWTMIQLKYYQTLLYELSGVILDGGRHVSPCPKADGISLNNYYSWDLVYRYFIKDSLEYIIHDFYLDDNNEAMMSDFKFMQNILVFNSEEEHQKYNGYILENWDDTYLKNYQFDLPYVPDLKNRDMSHFIKEIKISRILQHMLEKYRNE